MDFVYIHLNKRGLGYWWVECNNALNIIMPWINDSNDTESDRDDVLNI